MRREDDGEDDRKEGGAVPGWTLRRGAPDKTRADAVVVGVVRSGSGLRVAPGGERVAAAYGRRFLPLLATLGFTGRTDEVTRVPTAGTLRSPLLVLVGLGPVEALGPDAVRRAAGRAMRSLPNAASVALALPARDPGEVGAVVEGGRLGLYSFTRYKSGSAPGAPHEVVVLSDGARSRAAQQALHRAEVVADLTALARDWVNTPACDLTPAALADAVTAERRARKPARLTVEVLDEERLRRDGFGGTLGVAQGSANPARLVRLEYRPRGATAHLALVGKGVTYDSGGLSIKTSAGLVTMKSDMSGAAAVLAAGFAVAELELPVRLTVVAPMAENMVSGSATRPGDVLTMYGGRTVEVLNTDAEGRLLLADGLELAGEAEPDLVVDVASLTGACEVALGDRVSGLLGNDDELAARVVAAGRRAGETHWPLPIAEEMPVKVRTYSTVADLMQHNVDVVGGALYAAAFLQEFVHGRPWAHLDIAGPGFNARGPHGHVPSGGTGFGVATLVALVEDLAAR